MVSLHGNRTVTKTSTEVEHVLPKVTILKRTLNLIDQILIKLSSKITLILPYFLGCSLVLFNLYSCC